jgi:hypothetical protein
MANKQTRNTKDRHCDSHVYHEGQALRKLRFPELWTSPASDWSDIYIYIKYIVYVFLLCISVYKNIYIYICISIYICIYKYIVYI